MRKFGILFCLSLVSFFCLDMNRSSAQEESRINSWLLEMGGRLDQRGLLPFVGPRPEFLPSDPDAEQISRLADRMCEGDPTGARLAYHSLYDYILVRGDDEFLVPNHLIVDSTGTILLGADNRLIPGDIRPDYRVAHIHHAEYLAHPCADLTQLIVQTARNRGIPIYHPSNETEETEIMNAFSAGRPMPTPVPPGRLAQNNGQMPPRQVSVPQNQPPVPQSTEQTEIVYRGSFSNYLSCYASLSFAVRPNAEFRAWFPMGLDSESQALVISAVRGRERGFYLYRGDMAWYIPWSALEASARNEPNYRGYRRYFVDLRLPGGNRSRPISSRLFLRIYRNDRDTNHLLTTTNSFVPFAALTSLQNPQLQLVENERRRLRVYENALPQGVPHVQPTEALDNRSREVFGNTLLDLIARLPANADRTRVLEDCNFPDDARLREAISRARSQTPTQTTTPTPPAPMPPAIEAR